MAKVLRCAQVGAFRPMSQEDRTRNIVATMKLAEEDRDFLLGKKRADDIVNLVHGRDFLRETKTYDLVIVHSVLSPKVTPEAAANIAHLSPKELRVSDLHAFAAWKGRLAQTRARYIVICEGQPITLSGWELGELAGYKIVWRDAMVTLYRRVS